MIRPASSRAAYGPGDRPSGSPDGRAGDRTLEGTTILLVEDEAFLGLDLQYTLEDTGATVIGPIPSLAGAVRAANNDSFDAAILDVDLQGLDVFPAAEILVGRGIPFLFHTGHATKRDLALGFGDAPVCAKPIPPEDLLKVLARLIREQRQGS
jgi:DNA-binding response OmpR family regulator